MRSRLPCLIPIVWSVVGCDTTSTTETQSSCFGACLEADANVDLALELEAVGNVTAALDFSRQALRGYVNGALSLGDIVASLVEGDALSIPDGYRYEGDGQYSVDLGDGAVASLAFYWPIDSAAASAGDRITWDLFDENNYFTGLSVTSGVSVSLSGVDSYVTFEFDDAGPGAELLGLGTLSSGSLDVDVDAMKDAITETTSSAVVTIQPDAFGALTELELDTVTTATSSMSNGAIPLVVAQFSGESADGTQSLEFDSAELSLVDGGAGFTGELRFASLDSAFSFDARLRFTASASAEVQLGCPGTELLFPDESTD